MLSTRGGYLATESLGHTSCCVGSLNNSGITVKECAGHIGLKSQSANISWGMRFEECCPRLWMAIGSKRISTHGRGVFSRTRQPSERKRKETSASTEGTVEEVCTQINPSARFFLDFGYNAPNRSSSSTDVLHKPSSVAISHCCFADDSEEMDNSEKRTCRACKAIVFAH